MFDHYMNIVKDHEWTEVNGKVGILSCECVEWLQNLVEATDPK